MKLRCAEEHDIFEICSIYNQGIEDRNATLETCLRTPDEMIAWFKEHSNRYFVLLAETEEGKVIGWASVNPFNGRCCYDGVGDISVYVSRLWQGKGVGKALLDELCVHAKCKGFHKLVLAVLQKNTAGLKLYLKCGFREVGIYMNHGILDEALVNVVIMEKLL